MSSAPRPRDDFLGRVFRVLTFGFIAGRLAARLSPTGFRGRSGLSAGDRRRGLQAARGRVQRGGMGTSEPSAPGSGSPSATGAPPVDYAPRGAYVGEPVRETPWAASIVATALFCLPLIVLCQVLSHLRVDVTDDQLFGYFGWRIAHGATVYLDVWDNKPPGIYWINALGFLIGNDSYGGVIALCAAALLVAHAAFYTICASLHYRSAAALSTVLASFFITHGYFQAGTNRTETFLIAFELSAVAVYVRACTHDRWWKFMLVGTLCGGAFLFKQVGLAAWGAMGLHTIIQALARDISFATGARRCVLMLAGLAVTLAAAGAYLASQGALEAAWFATFTFNRSYFAVGDSRASDLYGALLQLNYHFPVLRAPILMAIAALIHAFIWWLSPETRPADMAARLGTLRPTCPRPVLLFAIWATAALYGALVSPHRFRHYIIAFLPPLMLVCSHLINVLTGEFGLFRRMQQRALVVTSFVAIFYFAAVALQWQWEEASKVYVYRIERGERPESQDIGERVAALTGPNDRIQAWGYMPGVYLYARRLNVCRFTTTEKMGHVGGEASFVGRELHQKLMAEPPTVFVISAEDYEWLHGRAKNKPLQEVDPLAGWLDENYERVDELHNVYVFRRKR